LDYKNAERDYLEFKLKMIEAELLKFDYEEFKSAEGQSSQLAPPKSNAGRRATVLL